MENEKIENENNECAHYWIIGEIKNGISIGICKKCGAKKDFIAIYTPNNYWGKKK
jgi:hypothetical protein